MGSAEAVARLSDWLLRAGDNEAELQSAATKELITLSSAHFDSAKADALLDGRPPEDVPRDALPWLDQLLQQPQWRELIYSLHAQHVGSTFVHLALLRLFQSGHAVEARSRVQGANAVASSMAAFIDLMQASVRSGIDIFLDDKWSALDRSEWRLDESRLVYRSIAMNRLWKRSCFHLHPTIGARRMGLLGCRALVPAARAPAPLCRDAASSPWVALKSFNCGTWHGQCVAYDRTDTRAPPASIAYNHTVCESGTPLELTSTTIIQGSDAPVLHPLRFSSTTDVDLDGSFSDEHAGERATGDKRGDRAATVSERFDQDQRHLVDVDRRRDNPSREVLRCKVLRRSYDQPGSRQPVLMNDPCHAKIQEFQALVTVDTCQQQIVGLQVFVDHTAGMTLAKTLQCIDEERKCACRRHHPAGELIAEAAPVDQLHDQEDQAPHHSHVVHWVHILWGRL